MRNSVAILLAFIAGLYLHTAVAAEPGHQWSVASVDGAAALVTDAGERSEIAAGDHVGAGQMVETSASARVVLKRGETSISVAENSQLRVPVDGQVNGRTRLEQLRGISLFKVKKRSRAHFQVDTPLIAAVVKGTTFTVNASGASHAVHVIEGLVEVSSRDGVAVQMVRPGATAVVSAADPSSIDMRGETGSNGAEPTQRNDHGADDANDAPADNNGGNGGGNGGNDGGAFDRAAAPADGDQAAGQNNQPNREALNTQDASGSSATGLGALVKQASLDAAPISVPAADNAAAPTKIVIPVAIGGGPIDVAASSKGLVRATTVAAPAASAVLVSNAASTGPAQTPAADNADPKSAASAQGAASKTKASPNAGANGKSGGKPLTATASAPAAPAPGGDGNGKGASKSIAVAAPAPTPAAPNSNAGGKGKAAGTPVVVAAPAPTPATPNSNAGGNGKAAGTPVVVAAPAPTPATPNSNAGGNGKAAGTPVVVAAPAPTPAAPTTAAPTQAPTAIVIAPPPAPATPQAGPTAPGSAPNASVTIPDAIADVSVLAGTGPPADRGKYGAGAPDLGGG